MLEMMSILLIRLKEEKKRKKNDNRIMSLVQIELNHHFGGGVDNIDFFKNK